MIFATKYSEIDQLDDPRWFPYRYGQALWVYLAGRFGEDVVARSLKSKSSGGAIGRLVATTGVDIATLSSEWHESIRSLSGERANVPGAPAAATVLTSVEGGGRFNVGPALSPDGKSIVYFSDRDRYSLDVVLADTATGDIKRKLVATAGDPHFESLQFIDSVGTWDPAGNKFALAALSGGRPVLTLLDVTTGDIERELPIEDVDQIFNPTWSPDGRQIAFSALRNGFSDLYVLDLETKGVRSLTADPYGDLHPAWSPDGRTIAFSTDRFSSSVQALTFGNFRLGLIEVASGTITELPGIDNAKNIDPHWSADGASLYFVADAQKTSNIYRASIADGTLFRVTDVSTGVSGVTALSPAIGMAAEANQLAFTVYRRGRYEIRIMDASPGEPLSQAPPVADLGSPTSEASALVDLSAGRPALSGSPMPSLELPDARDFTTKPYNSRLSLSSIARPYVSAGGGGAGSFIRAGVALSFGDMLGDHRLQTSFQVGKTLDDFIAQAAYLNMRSRWNWAVVGGQVPWLTAAVPAPNSLAEGTIVRETSMLRQLHRQASGLLIYPFSNAKRFELTGGVQSITYDRKTTSRIYSQLTGRLLDRTTTTTSAAAPAMLAESGAALVYDTAIFGPTSPILGERYRFAVAPTFGSLSFTSVTADYRRYLMPVRPFTIAMRLMHLGRYGGGSSDPRLLPLVFTLRDVVRGFGDTGRVGVPGGVLRANRMLVGNVELRFPLLAPLNRRAQSSSLPIEGLLFADAGQFWLPRPRGEGAFAKLQSLGAGIRLNAAGFVFEIDGVRPLGRTSRGWTFSLNFRPGF